MANAGFNGTTVTFGTTAIGGLRGISVSSSAATVDIGDAADTTVEEVIGRVTTHVSVDLVGAANLPAVSSEALALAIVWFDGTTTIGSLTKCVCISSEPTGSMDGEVTGTCVFANTSA